MTFTEHDAEKGSQRRSQRLSLRTYPRGYA